MRSSRRGMPMARWCSRGLCPVDYHRFHFPGGGRARARHSSSTGRLFSVSPIALRKRLAYLWTNKRTITRLETERFGTVLLLEIGATCVGTIRQTFTSGKAGGKRRGEGLFRIRRILHHHDFRTRRGDAGGGSRRSFLPPNRTLRQSRQPHGVAPLDLPAKRDTLSKTSPHAQLPQDARTTRPGSPQTGDRRPTLPGGAHRPLQAVSQNRGTTHPPTPPLRRRRPGNRPRPRGAHRYDARLDPRSLDQGPQGRRAHCPSRWSPPAATAAACSIRARTSTCFSCCRAPPTSCPSRSQELVQDVLYLLWDVGFKVGHACRSIAECIEQAKLDQENKTSLMDARLIAGDAALVHAIPDALRQGMHRQGPGAPSSNCAARTCAAAMRNTPTPFSSRNPT